MLSLFLCFLFLLCSAIQFLISVWYSVPGNNGEIFSSFLWQLQRKRHIGNDIVCVVFLEADNTSFSPACIKSHFLHTFILVRVSPRIKRKITRYEVSVVTRDEVGAYKPYLWEQSVFEKGAVTFILLYKIIQKGKKANENRKKGVTWGICEKNKWYNVRAE